MEKAFKIESLINKLKSLVDENIKKKKFEEAIAAANACANIMYQWNQKYTDFYLEENVKALSRNLISSKFDRSECKKNVILFYDNFGLDTRGLALIYLKAIARLGYHLIYVRPEYREIPKEIYKNINEFNVTWETFSNKTYLIKLNDINGVLIKYKPEIAFFYSTPDDIVGASIFFAYKDIIKRYQINLTDHAYWIGINTFDYCIEFRDYGAYISNKYRKIEKEKLIKLPFYPYINKNIKFLGFPFDTKDKKIIFSGGALYKTLGDSNNYYYKIISEILSRNIDAIFLYAGDGDTTNLKKLSNLYPNRVYNIKERMDLYQIMQHITLYLNTYPILGGLMTQYAAVACKIPISLVRKNDVYDGFLINQKDREIEYTDYNILIKDVDRLLKDEYYRSIRENKLVDSVITEAEFERELQKIMTENKSKYNILYKEYNDKIFLKEYIKRANYDNIILSSVAVFQNRRLFKYFGKLFIKKIFYKILNIKDRLK